MLTLRRGAASCRPSPAGRPRPPHPPRPLRPPRPSAVAARERLPRRLRRGLRVRSGEGGSVSVSVRVPSLAEPLDLGRVRAEADLGAAR